MVDVAVRQDHVGQAVRVQAQHFDIADQLRRTAAGARVDQHQFSGKVDQINGSIVGLRDIRPADQINSPDNFFTSPAHNLLPSDTIVSYTCSVPTISAMFFIL